jgi:hypothetical protein
MNNLIDHYFTAAKRFIRRNTPANKSAGLIVTLLLAIIGIIFIDLSRAATPAISAEVEQGAITSPAAAISDTTASSSHAVKFSASATPTPVPTPTPTPPPSDTTPNGPTGNWTLAFDDEFNGTSIDTSKWARNWYGEGGTMNGAGTFARNVSVSGGAAILVMDGSTSGSLIHTDISGGYRLPVGSYTEARIWFSGQSATSLSNWSAWWASAAAADGWPSSGEHDIAEILGGQLTVNYHSPSGAHNQGAVSGFQPGNSWHTYGLYRQTGKATVYWDGKAVKSYNTDDNGKPEILILNVGKGSNSATGLAGAMKVDYVRAWKP